MIIFHSYAYNMLCLCPFAFAYLIPVHGATSKLNGTQITLVAFMPAIIQRGAAKFLDETYAPFSKGQTRSLRRTQPGSEHRVSAFLRFSRVSRNPIKTNLVAPAREVRPGSSRKRERESFRADRNGSCSFYGTGHRRRAALLLFGVARSSIEAKQLLRHCTPPM